MPDHPLNRHLFVADNISLLRSLDNETIDLICIDPPFAKNQTFIGNLPAATVRRRAAAGNWTRFRDGASTTSATRSERA